MSKTLNLSLCNHPVRSLVSWKITWNRPRGTSQKFKMELANILLLFVVYIQYQNVSGFIPPYQMQYLETVTVPWPYNHYYPIYQQQSKQFNVSLSLLHTMKTTIWLLLMEINIFFDFRKSNFSQQFHIL